MLSISLPFSYTVYSISRIELKKSPQDKDQKLAVVNMVMNLHVWVEVENFLTNWMTISF
jgi:hypothetical protein